GNGRGRACPRARREEDGLDGLLRIRWWCGFYPDPPLRRPPAERCGLRPSLQRHPERRPLDGSVLRRTRTLLRPKHRTLASLWHCQFGNENLKHWCHEKQSLSLLPLSFPSPDHQLCSVGSPSLLPELPRCRGSPLAEREIIVSYGTIRQFSGRQQY